MKKAFKIIAATFLIFITSLFVYFLNFEIKDDLLTRSYADYPENVRYAYEVMKDFAVKLKNDHQFFIQGFHVTKKEEKIDLLDFSIAVSHPASLEEARALQLLLTRELISALNKNEKIIPHLLEYPVSSNSISISLNFKHPENISYNCYIDYVHTSPKSTIPENRNRIFYYRYGNELNPDFNFDETYEEAEFKNKTSSPINPFVHQPTDLEKMVESLDRSFAKKLKKYNLYENSLGIESPDKLAIVMGKFTCPSPASQMEARYLLVSAVEMLLCEINRSEAMRPLLKEYPITANNLKFNICFEKNGIFNSISFDHSVNKIFLDNGKITYFITDSQLDSSDTVIAEDYNEALKEAKEHFPSYFRQFKMKLYVFFGTIFYCIKSFFAFVVFWVLSFFF